MDKIQTLRTRVQELDQLIRETTLEDLLAGLQPLFDQCPTVLALAWYHMNEVVVLEEPCRARFPKHTKRFTVLIGKAPPPGNFDPEEDFFEPGNLDPEVSEDDRTRACESLRDIPMELLFRLCDNDVYVIAWRGGILAAPLT